MIDTEAQFNAKPDQVLDLTFQTTDDVDMTICNESK